MLNDKRIYHSICRNLKAKVNYLLRIYYSDNISLQKIINQISNSSPGMSTVISDVYQIIICNVSIHTLTPIFLRHNSKLQKKWLICLHVYNMGLHNKRENIETVWENNASVCCVSLIYVDKELYFNE